MKKAKLEIRIDDKTLSIDSEKNKGESLGLSDRLAGAGVLQTLNKGSLLELNYADYHVWETEKQKISEYLTSHKIDKIKIEGYPNSSFNKLSHVCLSGDFEVTVVLKDGHWKG